VKHRVSRMAEQRHPPTTGKWVIKTLKLTRLRVEQA